VTAVEDRAAGLAESSLPEGPPQGASRTLRDALREALRTPAILRDTPYGLKPFIVFLVVTTVVDVDGGAFGALYPEIRTALGIDLRLLAAINTVAGTATLLFTLPFGYLADRIRRVTLLALSLAWNGVFSIFTAGAQGAAGIFGFRVVDAVGGQSMYGPTRSLLPDYYPVETRGKMQALDVLSGRTVGLVTAPLTGFIAVRYGWRMPFVVTGAVLIVCAVVVVLVLREPVRGYFERRWIGADEAQAARVERPPSMGEAVRTVLANKTLMRRLVSALFVSTGFLWYQFSQPFLLAEKFDLNAFERSLVNTAPLVAGIPLAFLGGSVLDLMIQKHRRRANRMILLVGAIGMVSAVARIGVVNAGSLPLLVACNVVVVGALSFNASASGFFTSVIVPPRMRGTGFSVIALVFVVPSLLQPIGAQFAQSYGFGGAMSIAAGVMVVGELIGLSSAKFFDYDMRATMAAAGVASEYEQARAGGQTKLLVCRDVDVAYGSVQVLFHVDFSVDDGEIVALLGTNGAGKSTLLRAIAGTQEASNGAIVFDGDPITHKPPFEIARSGIALMPGGRGIFPGLSVRENLDLAVTRLASAERSAALDEVFAFFPVLRDRLDQDASLLSGGEQQMVSLAQAFLSKPRLLMIDELSLGLSPAVVTQLLAIVRAMHAEGTAIVLVEQSVNVALEVAQRAVFMEKGEVRFEGSTADLLARPDLIRAVYLKGSGALTPTGAASARATAERGRPLLEVEGVTKRFGGKTAVGAVSFTLHEGEALGFIGPNGAGKTTLFDLISGYQSTDAGRIVLDGADISGLSPDARARARLVRRFQDARLFPALTVFDTICVALERRADVRNTFVIAAQIPAARRSEARIRRGAERLIELFELGASRDKYVSELSTGLRRVVDLACVLGAEPRVLLLDEPSSGIAQAEAESLGPLLRRVRFETGCSLLIIEHDVTLIKAVSDELVAMVEGVVVVQGDADDVLSHPLIVSAYLGGGDGAAVRRQGHLA
jgi:branched-chain amino acid transport system ATP-binding protein